MTPEEFERRKKHMYYLGHREECLERSSRWNAEHREECRERSRQWYQANKEAKKDKNRQYYQANKGRFRGYYAKQKAKKAAALLQQDSGQPEDPATNAGQV